ncbi:hypothetical protein LshimejAT787_1400270 [Lyophyllum shimeji]|uniref:Uncharacterized protein n=1 Tax=Lyophyllum shimeji TaxID=47721 RepID=A0A9P3PV69_LYOSH|nr:hypothetical protein LshimejAT787_1400270 [Lyophyllum shimeji]
MTARDSQSNNLLPSSRVWRPESPALPVASQRRVMDGVQLRRVLVFHFRVTNFLSPLELWDWGFPRVCWVLVVEASVAYMA